MARVLLELTEDMFKPRKVCMFCKKKRDLDAENRGGIVPLLYCYGCLILLFELEEVPAPGTKPN